MTFGDGSGKWSEIEQLGEMPGLFNCYTWP
jgi:hypothetical protein